MAKEIKDTPVIEGMDALRFRKALIERKKMLTKRIISEHNKELEIMKANYEKLKEISGW